MPRRRVAAYCLAILSGATAVIHFAVAGAHFQEYWLFGVFMLVTAWLQAAWAVVVTIRQPRLLLWAGALLNTGVIAVYLVTRTIGDVVGPTPNATEPFGFGDGLCTVLEAIVAAGCCWLLTTRSDRQLSRLRLVIVPAATGGVTAVLLSVALVAGGPEMVMNMSAGQAPANPANPALRLATASPAGAITMPRPGMQMAAGMKMASGPCTATPTAAQQHAAVSLVNSSWQGARKFQSLAAAKAAGYRPITPTGARVVHYLNPSYYRATMLGGPVLNTAQPQSLVYANTPHGAVLAAAMYIAPRGAATTQPGGCLTQWHVHTNLCLSRGQGVTGTVGQGGRSCPAGSSNHVTAPMMHVWFVPIPGGPTAVDAPDAQVVQAAERVSAPANGRA